MAKLTVEEILEAFFSLSYAGKQTATAARYARVEGQLRCFLDTDGRLFLTPDAAMILELESAFGSEGAFARIFDAEDLLYALRGFLTPRWLLPDVQDRRTQVSLTARLVQWLCSSHLVDRSWHGGEVRDVLTAAEKIRRSRARGTDPAP